MNDDDSSDIPQTPSEPGEPPLGGAGGGETPREPGDPPVRGEGNETVDESDTP